MPARVAVIGCGQFGTVIAVHAALLGHDVSLWARTEEEAAPLRDARRSPRLPGLTIPPAIRVTTDANAALEEAALVITAIPSQYARSIWKVLGEHLPDGAILVSVAKGFEMGTLLRPSEVLLEECPSAEVVALSGPTIATELALSLPTALVVAGCPEATGAVQSLLAGDSWRVYPSTDLVGVESAGALKNVIAIAAGMVDGMDLGMNAKATLLARGIAEMARLGVALGGVRETFFGVAGVGDLATTCFSPHGRNRTLGEKIGGGATLSEALASMDSVVEGVDTCRAVKDLAQRHGVEMPIAQAVDAVLFRGVNPKAALVDLMRRASPLERV